MHGANEGSEAGFLAQSIWSIVAAGNHFAKVAEFVGAEGDLSTRVSAEFGVSAPRRTECTCCSAVEDATFAGA